MIGIGLTDAQKRRLRILEKDDPDAKIVAALRHCPVVDHSGKNRPASENYRHLAIVAPNGRLRGFGKEMERQFRVSRRLA